MPPSKLKPLVKSAGLRARAEIFVRSGPQPVNQDLSTRYDWPVEKAIVDLPSRFLKEIQNTQRLIRWEPKTKISEKLRRRSSCQRLRSDYVCDSG